MKKYQRALGAAVAVAVVGAGVAAAPAAQATDRAPRAHVSTVDEGLLDALLLIPTQLPVLSGTAGVGNVLDLAAPVWNLLGVTNNVQWLRNGVAIPGATSWTYTPGLDDAGSTLQAVVTGSLLGLLPVQAVSNALPIPLLGGGGGGVTDILSVLQLPTLDGLAEVGSLLSILDPVWSLPGVSMAYQWVADGSPIDGATGTSYIPVLGDAGKEIWAIVTGTLLGLPVVNTVTGRLSIPLTSAEPMSASQAPTVSGEAKVGRNLQVGDPTWSQSGVTNTYQWMRDNTAIAGATARTYTLTANDLGHQVSAKVTGTKTGYTNATVSSNSQVVQLGDAPSYSSQPTVTGRYAAGQVLTANPGSWGSGATPSYSFQWKRDGQDVAGATAATYSISGADLGHALAVTVTAIRTGYRSATFTTSPVAVGKVATTTSAKLKKAKIPATKRAALVVRVGTGTTGIKPAGKVAVYDGKKLLKRYAVNGSKTLTLPKLKAGVHRIRVVFTGSQVTKTSRSKVLKLTVVKGR